MNKFLKSLLALPLALILAFGFASISTSVMAEEGENAQFVDGNWFSIASSKGEVYQVGSQTHGDLMAQLKHYQDAVDADDTASAEKFAIRSWVKGWYAAELGRRAAAEGRNDDARNHYNRAIKYGETAQKPGAGKGETPSRVSDDSAKNFGGTSAVEGARVVKYAKKLLARL